MRVELINIPIRELVAGYKDDGDDGVVGYDGKLDIRPPYQREFIYKREQSKAVIETIKKGFPLNLMYWAVRDDGTYEIIDGQQRTVSIAQYVNGDYSIDNRGFPNLHKEEKNQILDYELMVYLCSGTDSEKLEWFKTINIAGEELTDQELRNAVYVGPWVAEAKKYFSRRAGPSTMVAGKYISGSADRQEHLETAIKWASKGNIVEYMAKHQHDKDAQDLWKHFEAVINWVKSTFTKYRKPMKNVDWGSLYDSHKDDILNPDQIEEEVKKLFLSDDVTKNSGIYPFILNREEKHLSIRAFTNAMKQTAYERQSGKCAICGKEFDIEDMEADHITPWSEGGQTSEDNCQILCKEDNRRKGAR